MSASTSTDYINNYYSATRNNATAYPTLKGDHVADVVVIGAGSTGINCALELAERGLDVVVIEANRVGWGATGRNGGQVTGSLSGDAAISKQLQKMVGSESTNIMRMLRWHGHKIIKQRVKQYNIKCDLEYGHLHTAYRQSDIQELQTNLQEAQEAGLGDHVQWLDRTQVQEKLATPLYHGGVLNTYNMHIHSLNLCLGEAAAAVEQGTRIFEQSHVENIEYNTGGANACVRTSKGSVTTNTVVLAGNAYHRLAQRELKGLVFPAILGNLTTAPLSDAQARQINPDKLAVYDSRMVLDYYRLTADNRLMFGGGTNYSGRDIHDVARALRPALEKTFPTLEGINIDYAWTGTAGIVVNRVPALGRINNSVYYAQGYSGHGLASSHIMAEILAEAIDGTMKRFDIFSQLKHIRLPVGAGTGSALVALGMAYYGLKEKFSQLSKN